MFGWLKLDGWMVGGSDFVGLEGCQRLMQFTHLLWCGLRRGIAERGARMALAVDGRENRRWGVDAERHKESSALLCVVVRRPRRLVNADRRAEVRRGPCPQKTAHEVLGNVVEEV